MFTRSCEVTQKWRKSAIQLVSRCGVIELRRKRHPSNTCISNLRLNRDHGWWQLCCRVNRSMTSRVMFGFTLVKYVARHYRSSVGSEVIITALSRTQQYRWVCFALLRDIIDAQLFALLCVNTVCVKALFKYWLCRVSVKRPDINQIESCC